MSAVILASYPKSGKTWLRLYVAAYADPDRFDINMRPVWMLRDVEPDFDPAPEAPHEAGIIAMTKAFDRPFVSTHACNVPWARIIPSAVVERVIYLMRDPRDVALSYGDHNGVGIDDAIGYLADPTATVTNPGERPQPLGSWSMNVASWALPLPDYPHICLRYERMVEDPEAAFRLILWFLYGTVDEGRHQAALELTRFENLQAMEAEKGFNLRSPKQARFFRAGRAGAWREKLNDAQIARIERDHGTVMRLVGYLPEVERKAA